ncbi:putative glycoside hydrolase [Anaerococcus sp. AGMB00486]|uniref:Glycoside hydrolase n=2 Tax=Anaerococcus TaxID=165779 RepID=A0ABX2N706_9FIRM|nr:MULTISPECIES: putative glycoside hydrolase [Anaerococcus]MDY3007112.1 putative glycoside hydrolase [Anaerococcus porci]MSS77046.1 GTP-binding protein [Anaerococcus porci]NVF10466.1 putative glycoside hydrolase [Anaerococcus faecalis]
MKHRNFLLALIVSLIFMFTSCVSKDNKGNDLSNDVSSNKKLSDKREKKPIGEPYEVGITPDDYNMDYDTSRLKSLDEKKSKYYPKDGVKGLYFNTYAIANPKTYDKIINLLDSTKLNSVVIDIKDDWGNITCEFKTDNEDIKYATSKVIDVEKFIKDMHSKGIYVIGRITTFKDSVITKKHPEWGFTLKDGSLWTNANGEAFMNPFMDEVRKYDLEIAELAAKSGFDEIQFDYIRFAEGFETFQGELNYPMGRWQDLKMKDGEKRIDAITSFVKDAREMLQAYDMPCGIDVFGYAMQVGRAEGIGQDFKEMANEADVMSSMIYPSHWSSFSFDLEKPDLEPYELVRRYLKEEQKEFKEINHKPKSRPWIQDFTASWIGQGNYMEYDAGAVQAQVDAIYDSGQDEFLIWNSSAEYTEGVKY